MFQAVGPMLEMARIQSEINRLFDNLLELGGDEGEGQRSWMPNADISEGEENYIVQVELPGVALEDLTLSVDGGNIIIRGEKKPPIEEGRIARRHVTERGYGRFTRTISINAPINTHRASAVFREGVLKISFPKVNNRRGGEVAIPVSRD